MGTKRILEMPKSPGLSKLRGMPSCLEAAELPLRPTSSVPLARQAGQQLALWHWNNHQYARGRESQGHAACPAALTQQCAGVWGQLSGLQPLSLPLFSSGWRSARVGCLFAYPVGRSQR